MNKHILVIDDDPVLLTMTREYLEDAGFMVSTADCGIYSNHIIYGTPPPDLIVLDVIMPLMSGVKKASALFRSGPVRRHLQHGVSPCPV